MKTNYEEILDTANGLGYFSCNLYRTLAKKDGNLFFSPYSVSSALSLAYLGAKNNTKDQMAQVLGYRLAPSKVISSLIEIGRNLNSEKIKTNVANAAWIQKNYGILKEYIDVLTEAGDLIREVNFQNNFDGVRKDINAWVEEKTEQLIKDLIPEGGLNSFTRMVLVNAIYFKGSWATEFDPELTEEKDFNNLDGSTSKVEMMFEADIKGGYCNGPGFQAIRLPYGHEHSPVAMTIILPEDLKKFEAGFEFGQISTMRWGKAKITLTMPKFKLEEQCEMGTILSEMGMPEAFQSGVADFSGINGVIDLSVEKVFHKAVVEVNEEGTEAAAATAVVSRRKGVSSTKRVKIDIDHPFIFIIGDTSPLFMGRVIKL